MRPPVAPFIETLAPYQRGKPIEEVQRELGIKDVIKLASNENPLGLSPRARAALEHSLYLHHYPDGSAYVLRRALAKKHGVRPEEVATGNGSNDVIDLMIRTFVHGEDEVVIAEGSFLMFRLAAQAAGRKIVFVPMTELGIDLAAMAEACRGPRARMVFLDNPVNPTGTYFGRAAWERFLARVPEHVIIVMDEAYFEFARAEDYPDSQRYRAHHPNVVTLRTFSKIYGMAGLRLGYGLMASEMTDYFDRVRPPFNVSTAAQVAGTAALEDNGFVERSRRLAWEGVERLTAGLRALGLRVPPSQGNFVFCDFGREVAEVFEKMLREGVIIRPVANYGFATAARISAGTAEECDRCVRAVAKVLGK